MITSGNIRNTLREENAMYEEEILKKKHGGILKDKTTFGRELPRLFALQWPKENPPYMSNKYTRFN